MNQPANEVDSITLEDARAVLRAQAFNDLVQATMTRFEPGSATLEIVIRPELTQQFGFVHGGVLAYAADNALTFAAGSVLGPSVLTAGFTITYLRSPRSGTLRAEAVVTERTRRQAVCRCDIFVDEPGQESYLCAAAQGTIRLLESKAQTERPAVTADSR